MGTNYFFFTKNKEAAKRYFGKTYELVDIPDFGYEIHVAKTSIGWLPLFQAHEYCRSVLDLSAAFRSGEFRIYDEYEDEYTWDEFVDRVLRHNGGIDGVIPKKYVKRNPNDRFFDRSMPDHVPVSHFECDYGSYASHFFKDPQGYEFSIDDFA